MSGVTVFSPRREAEAVEMVCQRNMQVLVTLSARVDALITVTALHRSVAAEALRLDIWDWCRHELVPHVDAEEHELYLRAKAEAAGPLLVEGMLEEHAAMRRCVDQIGSASDPVRAVAAASALLVILQSHLKKENEQLLPLLARSPYTSLADVLVGLDALVTAEQQARLERTGSVSQHKGPGSQLSR